MTREYVDIESPFTGGKVFKVTDAEEKTFRGEKYFVRVCYYQCEDTGGQFTTTEQDTLWTDDLYRQYRKKHGIPSPGEIKAMREEYGFNYSQMSRILGFGVNQLKNYEGGQVPSESNGKMLRLASDPSTMMCLLEISVNEFSTSEYERIKKKIALRYFEKAKSQGMIRNLVDGYEPRGSKEMFLSEPR